MGATSKAGAIVGLAETEATTLLLPNASSARLLHETASTKPSVDANAARRNATFSVRNDRCCLVAQSF